jgi:hypothetical protein
MNIFVGHVERMRERISAYSILVEVPERRKQLGRPGRRSQDLILKEKDGVVD